MKSNVDLTENRDFNIRNNRRRRVREVLNDFSYENNAMGDLVSRHESVIKRFLEDKGVILQGDKEERASKRFADTFSDGLTCDSCGSFLYPYYNDTICQECNQRYEYRRSLDRMFWLKGG